jgi:hypothetical protein
MGKGSNNPTYSTPLAPWVESAHRNLLTEMGKYNESDQGAYQAYGYDKEGNRIEGMSSVAPFSQNQERAMDAAVAAYEGGDPYADYSNQLMDQANLAAYEMGSAPLFQAGIFDSAQAQQYMSPYMEQVSDYEKQAARDEYALQANRSDAERVASGARGGYREALAGFLAEGDQARTIGEIEARGRQAAFENAQQQFERDRQARLNEARFGLDRGTQLTQAYDQLARSTADLGTTAFEREEARRAGLERVGNLEQAMRQELTNADMEQFYRYQDDPHIRHQRMLAAIQGVPTNVGGTMQATGTPSLGSQLLGLGIGGISLANLLGPNR